MLSDLPAAHLYWHRHCGSVALTHHACNSSCRDSAESSLEVSVPQERTRMLPGQHLHRSTSKVMLTRMEEKSSQPKSRANCGTCSSEQPISTDFSIHSSVSLSFSRILLISKQQGKGEEKAVMKANAYNRKALCGPVLAQGRVLMWERGSDKWYHLDRDQQSGFPPSCWKLLPCHAEDAITVMLGEQLSVLLPSYTSQCLSLWENFSSITPNNPCWWDLACFPVSPLFSKGMISDI